MMKKFLLLFLPLALALLPAGAQSSFSEGTVTYAVSIGAVSGDAGFTEHAGTYTLTIKGRQIRKDLRMNNGYVNTILYNGVTGQSYSLQNSGGQNYAIMLDSADLRNKSRAYEGFALRDEEGVATIAGQPCRKAVLTYRDGSRSEIYYATAWTSPEESLFDRFPGIKPFPLTFEYRNEEGIVMHFAAEAFKAVPVESGAFRLPADYKIISNKAYKALRR